MAYKPYKDISIPKKYGPEARKAIARDVIDFIVKRSLSGKDVNNQDFPKAKNSKYKYSEGYVKSLDFKIAGKSPNKINLKQSFEMLNSIVLRNQSSGNLRIGIEAGDRENAKKAEGNELGTYGQKTPKPSRARKFIGIAKQDLDKILKKYPVENKSKLFEAIAAAKAKQEAAEELADEIALEAESNE